MVVCPRSPLGRGSSVQLSSSEDIAGLETQSSAEMTKAGLAERTELLSLSDHVGEPCLNAEQLHIAARRIVERHVVSAASLERETSAETECHSSSPVDP